MSVKLARLPDPLSYSQIKKNVSVCKCMGNTERSFSMLCVFCVSSFARDPEVYCMVCLVPSHCFILDFYFPLIPHY